MLSCDKIRSRSSTEKQSIHISKYREITEIFKKSCHQQVTKKVDVIESPKPQYVASEARSISAAEETLDSLVQADENCMNAVKNLAELHEETMSILNLQLAVEALDSGDFQFGIETLQTCAQNGTNAPTLYNLGICHERGIGVEQDRAKVRSLVCHFTFSL